MVKNDAVGYNRKAVLQFNLTGQSIKPSSKARLRLHVRQVSSDTQRQLTVSRLADKPWLESNLTWSSLAEKEQIGPSITLTTAQAGQWLEWDVSDLLVSGGVLNLMIENLGPMSSKSDVSFSSQESANPPQLILYP